MTRPSREELESMREDGASKELRESFAAAERAVAEWEAATPRTGLDELLDWVDQLREAFGDPEVDQSPWVGSDFRI